MTMAPITQISTYNRPTAPVPSAPRPGDRKTRVTVTIDPHLAAYAERLVEAGRPRPCRP